MNTRRVVGLIEVSDNVSLTTFTTYVDHCRATKLLCVFFELLLDVSGSKHDSLLLITQQ